MGVQISLKLVQTLPRDVQKEPKKNSFQFCVVEVYCSIETFSTRDMEATMEITCTEGNAVAMVCVFEQFLSQKSTKKYALLYQI